MLCQESDTSPPHERVAVIERVVESRQCLSNALRLETYIQDAQRDGDSELADFFRRAQNESRKGADQGKQQLRSRL